MLKNPSSLSFRAKRGISPRSDRGFQSEIPRFARLRVGMTALTNAFQHPIRQVGNSEFSFWFLAHLMRARESNQNKWGG